jgi:hypothetical protein
MSEECSGTKSTKACEQCVGKAKEVLHEGMRRHVRVQHAGRFVVDVPLLAVAVGALIAPVAMGLGVVVALASDCGISVEREPEAPPVTQQA